MPYSPTTWVNDTTPAINASNLNKMEQGIEDAHDELATKADAAATTTALAGKSDTTHNHDAAYSAIGHTHAINDLTDVDTVTDPPATGEVLKWNGSAWVPASDDGGGGGGTAGVGSVDGVSPALAGGNIDLIAGSNVTITPDDATDSITIAATVPDLAAHEAASDPHPGYALESDLSNTADIAKGDALVGFKQVGTGAIARTVHAKFSDFASVTDFGAVGDGTTDDTTAIQAAVDAARVVYFPPSSGGYGVSAVLNVPSDRTLLGCGYPGRIKKLSPTTSFQIIRNSGAVAVNNVTLDGLVVQGDWDHALTHPNGAAEGYCILFATNPGTTSCKNITIKNCEIRDWWGLPFRIEGGDNIEFSHNKVDWSSRDMITIRDKVTDLRVINNQGTNLGDDGIAINARNDDAATEEYPRNFTVTGNLIHVRPNASFGGGIVVRGGRYGNITGNTIYGAILGGIVLRRFNLKDPQDITVSGNTIVGNRRQETAAPLAIGIEIRGVDLYNLTIESNTIVQPENFGIQLITDTAFAARRISIVGNTIDSAGNASNATADGIQVRGGGTIQLLKIDENVIDNSARNGIYVGAAGGSPSALPTITNLSVSGNQVALSCQRTANLSQIRMESATKFKVEGNILTEGTACATGIRLMAGATNGSVTDNLAFNTDHAGAGTGVSDGGTGNTLADNKVA